MHEKILPIIKEPNKILRGRAGEVAPRGIQSKDVQTLIAGMKKTLKNTPDGVGLAAPQVNKGLRIFIVSEEAEEIDKSERRRWKKENGEWQRSKEKPYEVREWKYYVFINPVVKNISKVCIEDAEGCLSVPGKFGIVNRREKITVEALDESGKKIIRGASRFFARVMQHELDHLNGTLFIDKVEQFIEVPSLKEKEISKHD